MSDFHINGYALADVTLTDTQCDHLAASIPSAGSSRGGMRGLLTHPTVLQLLLHKQLGGYLWSVIGRDLVAVKATMYDRMPPARGQWHQDRVIEVRERMDVASYGPWSSKNGVPHVEPPASVLEQMVAVRLYLDACGPDDGPLRVLPGSHDRGKLDAEALREEVSSADAVDLHVAKGGVLLMRPLLVHASSQARVPRHRRVLHIVLAPAEAISPLEWQTAVQLRRAA
ncbi:MAG TPA: phytanoyl-CoA dioxygenase family protein [Thermoanaerobaculia bacterium]|nr:phytanoyl-CoA dioxygenase family protein [Thermoanaerobaculia bacterium]